MEIKKEEVPNVPENQSKDLQKEKVEKKPNKAKKVQSLLTAYAAKGVEPEKTFAALSKLLRQYHSEIKKLKKKVKALESKKLFGNFIFP